MSLRLSRGILKTFTFRMTALFSIGFILSSLILFGFAYFLVSSSLQANDRTAIRLKLKEYGDSFQTGGVAGIRARIDSEGGPGALRAFVIRAADTDNQTLFLKRPDEGTDYDFKQLERRGPVINDTWIQLQALGIGEDDVLDIASMRLPDGSVIQIGKGPEEREEVLDHFQNSFAAILLAIVILSLAGGYLLTNRALRPVRNLISVLVPIINTGQIKARIPVNHTSDEFEELSARLNQVLEKIDALVGGMRGALDSVAHDLRTPIARLRGVAEMALTSDPNLESYREALSDCLEESEGILAMLNTLMDISEVEAGSMKLTREEIDTSSLLHHVCELYRCVAEDKNISVKIDCDNGVSLYGDRNRLLQAVGNLFDNAIKYTASGGSIRVNAIRQNHQVSVEIRDTGVGIPPEDLPNIWDRFYRCDKSRAQRGLGLGLSLVKAIVQAHKGNIKVFSQPGFGSQFVIYLPASDGTNS
jgi:signal transduction histidine kinase